MMMNPKTATIVYFAFAAQILLSSFHTAAALNCDMKTCSYEYKYEKCLTQISPYGIPYCEWVDTQYRYCAERWGSKPKDTYGEIERIFGDDDRITKISGTGKTKSCKNRSDIERRYSNNNPGDSCSMKWSMKKWTMFSYTVPCWDSDAGRRLDANATTEVHTNVDNEDDDEELATTSSKDDNDGGDDDDLTVTKPMKNLIDNVIKVVQDTAGNAEEDTSGSQRYLRGN